MKVSFRILLAYSTLIFFEKKVNRPSLNVFESGFFIEDFTYYKKDSNDILDENNGRFCITPEFPNGTYAYFATFESVSNSSGKFNAYKEPKFPYLIGNSFNSKPISLFVFSKEIFIFSGSKSGVVIFFP